MSALLKCPRCNKNFAFVDGTECGVCRAELRDEPVLCVIGEDGHIIGYGIPEDAREHLKEFSIAAVPAQALRRLIERRRDT